MDAAIRVRDERPRRDGDAWQRLPGETDKQWVAFTIYRDMGPEERTVKKADLEYRRRNGRPIPESSRHTASGRVIEWSLKNRWTERAAAYDDHIDQKELAAQRRARVKAAARHAEQAAKVQQVLMHPVEVAYDRLLAVLDGKKPDELAELSTEDLIRLGRHVASILPDIQKAERDAYHVEERPRFTPNELRMKGEVLKKMLASQETVAMMERISFELSAAERDEAG